MPMIRDYEAAADAAAAKIKTDHQRRTAALAELYKAEDHLREALYSAPDGSPLERQVRELLLRIKTLLA